MCGKCLKEGETPFNLDFASLVQRKKKMKKQLTLQQQSEVSSAAVPIVAIGELTNTVATIIADNTRDEATDRIESSAVYHDGPC